MDYMSYQSINHYLSSGDYLYDYIQGYSCDPFEMYQDIFNCGADLQDRSVSFYSSNNKYNLICVRIPKNKDKEKIKQVLIHKDLQELKKIIDSNDKYFNILSCISYCGHTKTKNNARFMYALVIDLDNLKNKWKGQTKEDFGLKMLDNYFKVKKAKVPNYIVSSGHGIHLYYLFKEPIPMYQENIDLIYSVKKSIVDMIWTADITDIKKQYGDVVQGFRVGGTYTKNWKDKTQCYYISKEKYSLYDLVKDYATFTKDKDMITKCFNLSNHIDSDREHLSLQEAKEKFPNWYQRRIIEKQPKRDKRNYKKWNVNPALYQWWKGKLYNAQYGGRYWYCVALCVFAIKCNIDKKILIKDLYACLPYLNSIEYEFPFTKKDIKDALRVYKEKQFLWTRKTIEEKTLIDIPPSKRNGRTREEHIDYMNFCKFQKNKKYNCLGGQPKKDKIIFDYLRQNNNATLKDIMYECNCDKKTAIKYRKLFLQEK